MVLIKTWKSHPLVGAMGNSSFAKHFKLLVSGRCLEVVHHDLGDLFVQGFIALQSVRERGVKVEINNPLFNESVINVWSWM